MTLDEYKARLILDGIASVQKNETRQERIDGGMEGFNLCWPLNSPADFDGILRVRHQREMQMRNSENKQDDPEAKKFWRYRYATIQIEFVLERMKVIWAQLGLYSGPLSARAVLQAAKILGVS